MEWFGLGFVVGVFFCLLLGGIQMKYLTLYDVTYHSGARKRTPALGQVCI